MPRWRRTTACERATQWISLELDGEIAGLERAALARHTQRCDRCRSSREDVAGITRHLRAAPVEGPRRSIVIPVPQRRKQVARAGFAALTAAAAAAAFLAVFHGSSKPSTGALGFADVQQQSAFGQEHVSMEPTLFVVVTPPPGSFGARALR
jgi:predicted anti-sigma-YlaC factor YlaD